MTLKEFIDSSVRPLIKPYFTVYKTVTLPGSEPLFQVGPDEYIYDDYYLNAEIVKITPIEDDELGILTIGVVIHPNGGKR